MKNKFLTITSALVLSSAIASSASARDGFYVALRGGMTNSNMNDVAESSTTTATADIDFDNVWMMGGAVGYRYSYFRTELEYSYREDHEEQLTRNIETKFGSQNLMLNGYIDFMPNYVVSPYLSAGIGLSELSLTTSGGGSAFRYTNENEATNFTWSIGAGLTIRLNQCLNFDGGYRYMDMGDIDSANINAHEWYFGLRYTF